MKRIAIALLFLVIFTSAVYAQISCLDYGSAVYCSNGLSAIRSGNTMYFSDGTTVQMFGNVVTINNQTTEITQSNVAASYQAGQAIGAAIGSVIADVRQRGKFDRMCDVNPYAWGWMWNGSPGFCSKAAILDACSNVPQFDFSGFKYTGDHPNHLSWVIAGGNDPAGTLLYLPNPHASNWYEGEIKCTSDEAAHSVHLAQLWLGYKREVEFYLHDSHPHLSQDDSAKIINYVYDHPEAYTIKKRTTQMFEKIYRAVGANS